jgi:hypothetical protein
MFHLTVHAPNQEPSTTELSNGRYQIGSHPQCEISIPVSELADRSALLEVRGEVVFLRNLNSFPIYVGETVLQPGQQSDWLVDQTLLLSQNVYLDLGKVQALEEGTIAANRAKKTRSTIQLGVIVCCISLAYFLLSGDESKQRSNENVRYRFTEDLVVPLQEDPKYQDVLKSLREARIADVRWGFGNPDRAIQAYEILLDNELVRRAGLAKETESPVGRARSFAIDRIASLTNLKEGNGNVE